VTVTPSQEVYGISPVYPRRERIYTERKTVSTPYPPWGYGRDHHPPLLSSSQHGPLLTLTLTPRSTGRLGAVFYHITHGPQGSWEQSFTILTREAGRLGAVLYHINQGSREAGRPLCASGLSHPREKGRLYAPQDSLT